ncbi:MAG: DUF3883 domain-containing protein [Chloroflexi bacterium]|nr:DUF3883 domain-containing protein [Chloroflexota bacterium]
MAMISSRDYPWALPTGVPPAHLVRAALRSGGLIDSYGSPVPAARSTYLLYPSDALFPPEDLRLGESLLIDCGLLHLENGSLFPSDDLRGLLALGEADAMSILFERALLVSAASPTTSDADLLPDVGSVATALIADPDRREAFLIRLAQKHDDSLRIALGLRGEELVVKTATDELGALGRMDLAERVKRVSSISDQLGYDVIAPRIEGKRRLEVKTSARREEGVVRLFVSRTEIDVGLRDEEWALVACAVDNIDAISLVGWCRARALEAYLPVDGEGCRWVSAEIAVPATLFVPGLPPPV